jgi:hypothetical protein
VLRKAEFVMQAPDVDVDNIIARLLEGRAVAVLLVFVAWWGSSGVAPFRQNLCAFLG